ncbi:MAG: sulfatase [Planctomycetes bacterium]|nr:sulfatase [Planctomycetota bacterium]
MIPPRALLLRTLVAAIALCAARFSSAQTGPSPARPPNFLFILVDDLGRQDLACEGSAFHETPNIDRIARGGMRFSNGYSACQVCSPSRAAIQTGRYPARVGITDYIGGGNQPDRWSRNTRLLPARYEMQLRLEEVTIAEALKEHGYATFFAGKWHLGGDGYGPEQQGYDVNRGGHAAGTPPGGYFPPYRNPVLEDGPPGEELPVRLGRETAAFIAEHADQPFFAMLSFYSVHAPIQCSRARWEKYRAKAERMGLTVREEPRFRLDRTMDVRQVQDHPVYAGMVEAMDEGVGLALRALDEHGLAGNTVVIFTSDNGGVSSGDGFATSCLPLRGGKGRQWEGGIRQPFYVLWPGVTAGERSDVPAIGTDFYPTILAIAGLPARPEQHVDGVSLVPVLRGGHLPERSLFWHYPHYGNQGGEPSAIHLHDGWKLISYFEDQRVELYHVGRDLGEQRDLAAEYPERAAAMLDELRAWQEAVGARFPTPNPSWDAEAYARSIEELQSRGMPNREREHAGFLDPGFTPRGGWWAEHGAQRR